MKQIDRTHDPLRRSWVESANAPDNDFPLQNLPFGSFATSGGVPRVGVAIGDSVLDLCEVQARGLLTGLAADAAQAATSRGLPALMAGPASAMSALRAALSDLLCDEGVPGTQARRHADAILRPAAQVTMHLPCPIRGYTDFLASEHHTERNGRLKGLAVPVPEAYRWVPVAYHGRASTIVTSGTPVQRPHGHWKGGDGRVVFGPVQALDFELEMGLFVGRGNDRGVPIRLDEAREHIFGTCLLNDWSSKSVQWWEQMLGPFLGKNFITSISPWIVTREALEPFRVAAPLRAPAHPPLLPYLDSALDHELGSWSIALQASLSTRRMRESGMGPAVVTRTHLHHLYWTPGQLIAHHSSNGCQLETGDLVGTGTISGPDDNSRACMTELTSAGALPLTLPDGQQRGWLEDGDEIVFTARACAPGFVPIGFGECRGMVTPALPY